MKNNTENPIISINSEGINFLLASLDHDSSPEWEGSGYAELVALLDTITSAGLVEITLSDDCQEHTIHRRNNGEGDGSYCENILEVLESGDVSLTARPTTWGKKYQWHDRPKTRAQIEKLKNLKGLPIPPQSPNVQDFIQREREICRQAKVLPISQVRNVSE
jgi:hypothetical protein